MLQNLSSAAVVIGALRVIFHINVYIYISRLIYFLKAILTAADYKHYCTCIFFFLFEGNKA